MWRRIVREDERFAYKLYFLPKWGEMWLDDGVAGVRAGRLAADPGFLLLTVRGPES